MCTKIQNLAEWSEAPMQVGSSAGRTRDTARPNIARQMEVPLRDANCHFGPILHSPLAIVSAWQSEILFPQERHMA